MKSIDFDSLAIGGTFTDQGAFGDDEWAIDDVWTYAVKVSRSNAWILRIRTDPQLLYLLDLRQWRVKRMADHPPVLLPTWTGIKIQGRTLGFWKKILDLAAPRLLEVLARPSVPSYVDGSAVSRKYSKEKAISLPTEASTNGCS